MDARTTTARGCCTRIGGKRRAYCARGGPLPSTATRLGYLTLFGIGSTLGMVALSGLLGWQIARMGSDRAVVRVFSLAVGSVSTVLGLFWGYPFLSRWF